MFLCLGVLSNYWFVSQSTKLLGRSFPGCRDTRSILASIWLLWPRSVVCVGVQRSKLIANFSLLDLLVGLRHLQKSLPKRDHQQKQKLKWKLQLKPIPQLTNMTGVQWKLVRLLLTLKFWNVSKGSKVKKKLNKTKRKWLKSSRRQG